jgi:hypothetical protein
MFGRACDLPRLTLKLSLSIPGDPAETFFCFSADILGGPCHPIFVHLDSPLASSPKLYNGRRACWVPSGTMRIAAVLLSLGSNRN